jgi:hypothetical protein
VNTSKIELTDQLRRLGIWEDASRFKDECKRRLIVAGESRRDAGEKAWEQMEERFTGENLKRYQAIQASVMAAYPPMISAVARNISKFNNRAFGISASKRSIMSMIL